MTSYREHLTSGSKISLFRAGVMCYPYDVTSGRKVDGLSVGVGVFAGSSCCSIKSGKQHFNFSPLGSAGNKLHGCFDVNISVGSREVCTMSSALQICATCSVFITREWILAVLTRSLFLPPPPLPAPPHPPLSRPLLRYIHSQLR